MLSESSFPQHHSRLLLAVEWTDGWQGPTAFSMNYKFIFQQQQSFAYFDSALPHAADGDRCEVIVLDIYIGKFIRGRGRIICQVRRQTGSSPLKPVYYSLHTKCVHAASSAMIPTDKTGLGIYFVWTWFAYFVLRLERDREWGTWLKVTKKRCLTQDGCCCIL